MVLMFSSVCGLCTVCFCLFSIALDVIGRLCSKNVTLRGHLRYYFEPFPLTTMLPNVPRRYISCSFLSFVLSGFDNWRFDVSRYRVVSFKLIRCILRYLFRNCGFSKVSLYLVLLTIPSANTKEIERKAMVRNRYNYQTPSV